MSVIQASLRGGEGNLQKLYQFVESTC